ncbi:MAG: hypothetical protein ABIL70_03990 [candidate division WOR-3 bacterium]
MKKLLLLTLLAIPLFAFSVNFIYCDYDEDWDDEYWCDEYWEPESYCCDGYWVYYPYGYYCVYYVWYHPWWWDWYWWHCHWCHHFDWHFFCAGFYVVWYEDGCWWWRPRYGRWVRYKLPYSYSEFRYKASTYGVNLPDKPPREINLPYKEKEVMRLTKEKDPQLYSRLEKEYRSGNLERMQKEYQARVEKEIKAKSEEYQRTTKRADYEEKGNQAKSRDAIKRDEHNQYLKEGVSDRESKSRIVKRQRKYGDTENRYRKLEEGEVYNKGNRSEERDYNQKRGKSQSSRDYKEPIKNLPPYDYNNRNKPTGDEVKRYRS